MTLGDLDGAQFSGFANVALGDVQGTQVGGFGNACKDLNSAQVSGFINLAKKVVGTQIGFINIADTFEQGIPVGFFSYVKKGYRNYSFGINEVGWTEFQFRTGMKKLHNVFAIALNPIPGVASWAYGYGLGTQLLHANKSEVYLDLTGYHVHEMQLFSNTYNTLLRLSPKYHYHPTGQRFSIWGGPSLNLQQSATERPNGELFESKLAPYAILENQGRYINSKFWIGAQMGVSF